MAIYKTYDKDSSISIEFEHKDEDLIQIIVADPDNDYAGSCIIIQESEFKEIALAILKGQIIEK